MASNVKASTPSRTYYMLPSGWPALAETRMHTF